MFFVQLLACFCGLFFHSLPSAKSVFPKPERTYPAGKSFGLRLRLLILNRLYGLIFNYKVNEICLFINHCYNCNKLLNRNNFGENVFNSELREKGGGKGYKKR